MKTILLFTMMLIFTSGLFVREVIAQSPVPVTDVGAGIQREFQWTQEKGDSDQNQLVQRTDKGPERRHQRTDRGNPGN